jgi:hypothetical protein
VRFQAPNPPFMKYMLTLFLCVPLCVSAQVLVKGNDINQLDDVKYMFVEPFFPSLSRHKVQLRIDYSQKRDGALWDFAEDEEGKRKVFNSVADALNFLDKNGWDLEKISDDPNNLYILLKRKTAIAAAIAPTE